jgi:small-conductance mechanosensitive channel
MTLDTLFLSNPLSAWLKGLITAALVWLILMLLRHFIIKLTFRTHREESLLHQFAQSFWQVTIIIIALASLTAFLTLPNQVHQILRIIYLVAAGLQAGRWLTSLVDHWVNTQISAVPEGELPRRASLTTLGGFFKVASWVIVALIVLDNIPNFNLSSIIAGLGLGGIAIGLAAQNVIKDLLSSLTINLDKPFTIGDSIQVSDISGTVEHIGIRSTRLKTLSGEELIISNNDLLSSRVQNFQKMEERRVSFMLSLDYATPLEKLQRIPDILQELISRIDQLRFGRAHLKNFGENALQYEVVYFVKSGNFTDFVEGQHALNLALIQRFQQEDIRFGNIAPNLKVDFLTNDHNNLN